MKGLVRQIADAAMQLRRPWSAPAPSTAIIRAGTRSIRLGDQVVEYELRRSHRRTIGFAVDGTGLAVTAPKWVAEAEIESALRDRGEWVLRKLAEWRELSTRKARHEIRWEHGAPLPFLGQTLALELDPAHRGPVIRRDDRLRVGLPPGADPGEVRDGVQRWLQREARALFGQRIGHFSERLGIAPRRWALSSARTRWGSCGADGSIRLNWRLMHFPPEIVDYVVCHELAHLKELNHGPGFWNEVARLYPDHERAREWLRSYPGGAGGL